MKKGYNKHVPVIRRDLRRNYIARYKSITDAAEAIGKPPVAISNCINGKQATAYGSLWEIASGPDGRVKCG